MADTKATLKAWFDKDDAKRTESLQQARECAALTRAWTLPPDGHTPDSRLPDSYQSAGSGGVRMLSGWLMAGMFPPGEPWFQLLANTEYWHDQEIPDESKQELANRLFITELVLQSKLETVDLDIRRMRRRSTFQAHKARTTGQVVITGDALEQLGDDYRMRLFRRDQYVTKRDGSCDVQYHIIREKIDAKTLSEEQIAAAKLTVEQIESYDPDKRDVSLYTAAMWQPDTQVWVINQEVNGHIVLESQETVSPFMNSATYLVPGENYGRSIVEDNIGELRTLNELELRRIDLAALAAKSNPAVDRNSEVVVKDLEKPSGEPIEGLRVEGGVVQDVGWLRSPDTKDFQIVTEAIAEKRASLAEAFMSLSKIGSPQGRDRVTAFERDQAGSEHSASLSDVQISYSEDQQVPLLARTYFQAKRDNIVPEFPEDAMEVRTITGMSQLVRERRAQKVLSSVQVAQALGETALSKLNLGNIMEIYNRHIGLYEPGMVKSREEEQQQAEAEAAAQQQQIAAQAVADTSVNVATEAAKQGFGQ